RVSSRRARPVTMMSPPIDTSACSGPSSGAAASSAATGGFVGSASCANAAQGRTNAVVIRSERLSQDGFIGFPLRMCGATRGALSSSGAPQIVFGPSDQTGDSAQLPVPFRFAIELLQVQVSNQVDDPFDAPTNVGTLKVKPLRLKTVGSKMVKPFSVVPFSNTSVSELV